MNLRLRFIAQLQSSEDSFAEVCRQFNVSRKTGYKWLNRYEEEGPAALEDRPPIAGRIKHKLPPALVLRILEIRKEHPTWGPRKIRAVIEAHHFWRVPAVSTIGSVLKAYGLVSAAKRRRPRLDAPGAVMHPTSAPNDTWCLDFKGHFAMRDGVRCHPLTLTDHETRYLLKCEALLHPDAVHVRPHLERAFHEYGLPERMRSDNGPPFSTGSLGKLSELSVWWIKLGILPELIDPGHPEQNGRHERMHRTLKTDVRPQADLVAQQLAYDRYRFSYNEERPHEALGQKPPAKFFHVSRRRMPAKLPAVEYPETMETRRLDKNGRMRFRGSTHVLVSRLLANEHVGLEPVAEDTFRLYFGAVALASLEIRGGEVRFFSVSQPTPPSAGTADVT